MHRFLQIVLGRCYLVVLDTSDIVSSGLVSDAINSTLNHSFLSAILPLHSTSNFVYLKGKKAHTQNLSISFAHTIITNPIITAQCRYPSFYLVT